MRSLPARRSRFGRGFNRPRSRLGRAATEEPRDEAMPDKMKPPEERGHGLGDHELGQALDHVHPPGIAFDHDHDHFEDPGALEDNPLWLADHVTLVSVGIDIGSAGPPALFSPLHPPRLRGASSVPSLLGSLAPLPPPPPPPT